ncbi:hypothetical protein [Emticicia sp. 17c]|uniref:hypothetical protein n=1 Tax=Emticicia sp. 17c TaxID=3127704 RepID=UPI00301E2550
MKKIALLLCLFGCTTLTAQVFTPAFDLFSVKEVAYINLENGTLIEGIMKAVNRKNGLITSVVLTPTGTNKKLKINSEEILNMYLPISSFNKFDNAVNRAFNKHIKGINIEITDHGYAYFEKTKVVKKNEIEELLLQLVNPSFSDKIKVYDIPLSKQTTSTEIGGIGIELNENKAYFVKVGEATAVKLRKKDYDEAYTALYKDCPVLVNNLKDDHRWSKFGEHLWTYTKQCN